MGLLFCTKSPGQKLPRRGSPLLSMFLCAALALAASCGTLQASLTFTFIDIGNGFSATGILTATDNGNGSFTATSGSGLFNGLPITLINTSSAFFFDNVLFPAANPVLDNAGLLFSFAGHELNIWGNLPPGTPYSTWTWNGASYDLQDNNSVFTLSQIPEPATLSLIGGGLICIFFLRRFPSARSSRSLAPRL